MLGFRRQRECRQKAPVNYSDDKKPAIPKRQEISPVSSPNKKGPKKKGVNSGGQKKALIPCPNQAGGLAATASNTDDEESQRCNDFQGKNF